ncbi:MAG: B12-binding domain-containing radical SAM protein [Candidatus Hermodarchaeota archaeon]
MNVLFIQPFLIDFIHPCKIDSNLQDMFIWPVYLENFLKNKINNLKTDLLHLPIEKGNGKIKINSIKEKKIFYSQMDKLISNLKFEIDNQTTICVSVPSSFHYLSSILITEYLRDVFNYSAIVFGGPHVTACPNDFIFPSSPIDYIITNEGEFSLYQLMKAGIKKQDDPVLIHSNPIPILDDLPPLDLSLYGKYAQFIPLFSINLSRGCPYRCNFCMEKKLITKPKMKIWRAYSPKRAIKEINQIINFAELHNINSFLTQFNDPIFGMSKKWLNEFLMLYNYDLDSIWIESRVDILDEKILAKLQKRNFYQMYGLENCSLQMLRLMNKTTSPLLYLEKFKNIFKIHKKLDYSCFVNILLNYPGETEETILESLKNFKEIINTTNFSNFELGQFMYEHFPNTEVYNNFSYYEKNFGSISYYPKWWKDEETLYGAYCVKSSKDLSLKHSLNLFLKFNKEVGKLKNNNKLFVNTVKVKLFKDKILEKFKDCEIFNEKQEKTTPTCLS